MIDKKVTNKLVTIIPMLIEIISYLDYLLYNFKVSILFARLCALYPLNNDCTKLEIFYDNFVWFNIQFNLWIAVGATFVAMYNARSDLSSWLNSFSELIVIIEMIFLMVLYRLQRSRLRILLKIVDNYMKDPDDSKLLLIRRNAKEHIKIYSILIVLFSILAVIYVYKSFSTRPIQFILSGYYPYTSNSLIIWIIVFCHQLMLLLYSSSIFASDFVVTLLIFAAIIQLQKIRSEFTNIQKYDQLVWCIDEHQRIIWFIEKINYVIRLFILKTVFCLGALQLGVGIIILMPDISALTRIQFLVIFAITIFRIYIYAYCAEILTKSGLDLSYAVYSSRWYIQKRRMILAKSIIICRCQKPLLISIGGVIPALGMGYLARFLYSIFSYIIALQTITKK